MIRLEVIYDHRTPTIIVSAATIVIISMPSMTVTVVPVTTTVVVIFYITMATMPVMAMGAIIVMVHFPIRIMMMAMMVMPIVPDQRCSHCADGQTGHYRFCSAVAMSVRALLGHRHRYRHHTRQ